MAIRGRQAGLILGALIILVPAALLAIFIIRFNPNSYQPQLIAAVEQATGRRISFGSPIQMQFSLAPTISVQNVSLSNPAGFADPTMMKIGKIEAKIDLLPLLSHHLDITNLVLDSPDVTLETGPGGVGNWVFSKAPPHLASTGEAASPASSSHEYSVALSGLTLQKGLITIHQPAGRVMSLTIASLTARAASMSAPLTIAMQASYNQAAFSLSGTTGPVERFSADTGDDASWPVDLSLKADQAQASIQGAVNHPRQARGYHLAITGMIPALEALQPFVPALALPPIHAIQFTAMVQDQGAPEPAIDNVKITAGPSDLSVVRPGLTLSDLTITAPSTDRPVLLAAHGGLATMPWSVQGKFDAPGLLFGSVAARTYGLSVSAMAGAAQAQIEGAIAAPVKLAGVALSLSATIPKLTDLDGFAGTTLPAWTNIDLKAQVTDPGGEGLRRGFSLDSLSVTSDQASFGGGASLLLGKTPDLQASLDAQRIDLDALLQSMPASGEPSTASPTPTQALPVAPASPAGQPSGLFSTEILPFSWLTHDAADLHFSIDDLIWRGQDYRALAAHALLQNNVLTISKLTGQLPSGYASAEASVNAASNPPQIALSVRSPALALAPFLHMVGLPDGASGIMQAYTDLNASGDNWHQIAGSLNGQLGLAMVNGDVDGSVLQRLFGPALSAAALSSQVLGGSALGRPGPVAVRCFALRLDAQNGDTTVKAGVLDSSRALITAGGSFNLGNETLALVLQPQLRVGTDNIAVPVGITSSFRHPQTGLAPAASLAAVTGLAGQLAGNIGGGTVVGNFVQKILGGTDACAGALPLARGGQAGPMPQSGPSSPAAPGNTPTTGPQNLLKSLLQ